MAHSPERAADPIGDQWRRAGDIIRWLEQSGPRYRDRVVGFVSMQGGQARVILDGTEYWFEPPEMSFASWCICAAAQTGDALEIRLRDDPVRNVRQIP